MGNGYFLLSALDPEIQGIGGFAGGYNANQGIVCGVQPPTGEAVIPWYPIYADGGLRTANSSSNQAFLYFDTNTGVFNYSLEDVKVKMYLKAVSETDEITYSSQGVEIDLTGVDAENGRISGKRSVTVYIPQGLTAGTYKAYLVMKTPEGNWQDVLIPRTRAAYLNMIVAPDGKVSFTEGEPEVKAQIQVDYFVAKTTVEKDKPVMIDILVKNIGNIEYSGLFKVAIYKHDTTEEVDKININLDLGVGGTSNGYITHTFPLDDGLYDVICYDMYGDKISDVIPLRVGKEPAVGVTGITLDQTSTSLEVGSTLQLNATVTPDDAADKSLTWTSSAPEIATVDENGLVKAVAAGDVVITATSKEAPTVSAKCEIKVTAKTVAATGITLDVTEKTLVEGETLTLTATIDPTTATDKTVTWSSSDETVATVADGVVTAVKAGKATITAETSNGLKATCEVTVTAKTIAATGIKLDVTEKTLVEGETLTLTATIDPETATDKTVTWSSSDEAVATVADGVVTAVKAGTATITAATSNGLKATCEVTVTAKTIDATGITLDVTEKSLVEGETLTLTATIDPATATDKTVTWSSSDETVATVADGVVTAVKAGTATITAATANGLKATCEVTVTAKTIVATGITLEVTEKSLVEGETLTLTATIDPETATDKTVTWSSSDETVATVADGVVTAVKTGTATITAATSNGLKATCEITVTAKTIAVTGITLDVTEKSLVEGEALTLTATIDPATATDKTVTWSSSDEAVATVADGVVTAVKAGTTTITAETSNGLKATCEVTVTAKEVLATSISLDKESIEETVGTVVQLTATVLPDDATDKSVTWSSSDEGVATVDNSGKVTILGLGNATITATTADGSNLSAVCRIYGVSGIEAIIIEAGGADVYSISGILLKRNADREFISTLANGVYIIRTGGKTYKIVR